MITIISAMLGFAGSMVPDLLGDLEGQDRP